ncbi:hypothetical protein Q8F55_005562 [Vanrija albida]|uniref:Uncharacterized protein n=1 Tax=Vanrija albida TaxID=181172 RepID=A0ABR3Q1Z5_9TREE
MPDPGRRSVTEKVSRSPRRPADTQVLSTLQPDSTKSDTRLEAEALDKERDTRTRAAVSPEQKSTTQKIADMISPGRKDGPGH